MKASVVGRSKPVFFVFSPLPLRAFQVPVAFALAAAVATAAAFLGAAPAAHPCRG